MSHWKTLLISVITVVAIVGVGNRLAIGRKILGT
jgi:hypothetical protein